VGRWFVIGLVVILAAGAALVFWSRQPAPHEAVQLARQKMEDTIARSEARFYAPEAEAAVRESLMTIEERLESESRRLPFFRRYEDVRARLERFDAALGRLESEARQGKEAMRASAETSLQRAIATANDLDAELESGPRAKADREALRLLRSGLREVRERIGHAQSELGEGRVHSAYQEIQDALERADGLLQEVRTAKERMHTLGARGGNAP